jgi:hypothetical protein
MRIRKLHLTLVLGIALASAPLASAQPIYNPIAASPFSRPALSPYLQLTPGTAASTYYQGTLREIDIRNQILRPIILGGPDVLSGYDSSRYPGYQAVAGYQNNTEEWVNQRIRESQLSASGHPSGFLLPNPYYRMPNQRSFVPYNMGTGQPQPR